MRHQMTARTDRSDPGRYFPAYATGREHVEKLKSKRNASVELLRCFLMFLIVFHHCAYWGRWEGDGSQHVLIFLGSVACMWHVDAFVGISGWFGIKFTWKKFFSLWSQVVFYSALSAGWIAYSGGSVLKGLKAFAVRGGWFGAAYFFLMLMSPILNEAVESLAAKGRKLPFGHGQCLP